MTACDVMPVRLHLQGIRVLEVLEDLPDRLVVAVMVIGSSVACGRCGARCRRVHQTKRVCLRDLPVSGRPTTLVWYRRRFICDRCGATTTERHGQFGYRVTNRMAAALFVEVTRSTVNAVRKAHGLGWHLVMGIIEARVAVLAAHRRARFCRVLCIDEKRLTKGHGPFSTILTDGETGTVIGVIDGRSGATLEVWLAGQSRRWKAGVDVVVTDMASCWRATIDSELPRAAHVVDRFHVVRNAMTVLTEARRAAQRTGRGEPHRKGPYQARFLLATRCDRLDAGQIAELTALFDTHPQLAAAWELTQRFHRIWEAADLDSALGEVGQLADAYDRMCGAVNFAPGVRSLTTWTEQWQNYHRHGRRTTNVAEGVNTKIELLERKCYGLSNPTNHKTRIIADCPGHPPRPSA